MKELSASFADQVRQAWGTPGRIAEIAFNETFKHTDVFGTDYDDQIRTALQIGLMVGLATDKNVEAFLENFAALLGKKD